MQNNAQHCPLAAPSFYIQMLQLNKAGLGSFTRWYGYPAHEVQNNMPDYPDITQKSSNA
jgi:hypothetical protein